MKKIFSLCLILLLPLIIFVTPAFAQQFSSGNYPTLSKDKVVNGDYFTAGRMVTISGTVNGDVYAAGGTIIVNGTINGDLIAAGGSVQINGTISDDARVAGGNVSVAGTIGRNLTVGTGNGSIDSNAKIGGSVVAGGGNISVLAPVGKSLTVGGGQLFVDNRVNGNINAGVGKLDIGSNAKVAGSVDYTSNEKASIQPGAAISGKVTQHQPPQRHENNRHALAAFAAFATFWKIVSFLTTLILGIILLLLLPNFMQSSVVAALERTLPSLGIGFLGVIVFPAVIFILLLTLLGIPLALILLFAFIIYLWLAKIVASLAIGTWILTRLNIKVGLIASFILGLIIYELITWIPIIGGIFAILAILIGLGALLIRYRETYLFMRQKKQI